MFWDENLNKDETQKILESSLGDIKNYFVSELKQVPQLVVQNAINSAPTAEDLLRKKSGNAASETMAAPASSAPAAASGLNKVDMIKKYLPYIFGGIAVIVILFYVSKKR